MPESKDLYWREKHIKIKYFFIFTRSFGAASGLAQDDPSPRSVYKRLRR